MGPLFPHPYPELDVHVGLAYVLMTVVVLTAVNCAAHMMCRPSVRGGAEGGKLGQTGGAEWQEPGLLWDTCRQPVDQRVGGGCQAACRYAHAIAPVREAQVPARCLLHSFGVAYIKLPVHKQLDLTARFLWSGTAKAIFKLFEEEHADWRAEKLVLAGGDPDSIDGCGCRRAATSYYVLSVCR